MSLRLTRPVFRRYPPALDAELDGMDAGLATLKVQPLEGGAPGAEEDGVEEEEEVPTVLPSTAEERREAKRKLKEEQKKIKVG